MDITDSSVHTSGSGMEERKRSWKFNGVFIIPGQMVPAPKCPQTKMPKSGQQPQTVACPTWAMPRNGAVLTISITCLCDTTYFSYVLGAWLPAAISLSTQDHRLSLEETSHVDSATSEPCNLEQSTFWNLSFIVCEIGVIIGLILSDNKWDNKVLSTYY